MPRPLFWWERDEYSDDNTVPEELREHAGPQGVGLVRVWDDGRTDKGWGLWKPSDPKNPGFMAKYSTGAFKETAIVNGYDRGLWAFAFVMRSMKVVCIDIDGKNGGEEHVGKLGMLPLTMAETSRSGNGYHLFYTVSEDEWDADVGFGLLKDRIGITQGVDFRGTGCVYHYDSQRWNDRVMVELPNHLKDMLLQKQKTAGSQTAAITSTLESGDELEVAMLKDSLITDLAKPIPAGRRNTTLFAIGTQMCLAEVVNWETLVRDRARAVGLDSDEAEKIVRNIPIYLPVTP